MPSSPSIARVAIRAALTLTSLVLLLAVVAAWVATNVFGRGRCEAGYFAQSRHVCVGWQSSEIYLLTASYRRGQMPSGFGQRPGWVITNWPSSADFYGVSSEHWSIPMIRAAAYGADGFYGNQVRVIELSYPVLVVLFALAPAWWVVSLVRRRRRTIAGRCARCGYDLRATPQCCPECGTPVAAPAAETVAAPDVAIQQETIE